MAGAILITVTLLGEAISPPAWAAPPVGDAATTISADADASDPLVDVQRHMREAHDLRQQGLASAAADHLEAAFHLLSDARRWRDARGQVIAKAYETLLEAYNRAATADEKVRHGCRLRGLLIENVDGLSAAFGAAADDFPEVQYSRQKIANLELTISTHGDPRRLCQGPEDATMPATPLLLEPRDRAPEEVADAAAEDPPGPADAITPEERRRQRKAVAMTATGGTLIVVGGALLGVMSGFAWKGRELERQAKDPTIISDGDLPEAKRRGAQANSIAYATAATGAAAMISGIVLTAVGRKRMRSRELSVVPSATRTSAGATLSIRF